MVSGDDDGDDNHGGRNCEGERMEETDWFYQPFRYPGNQFEKGRTSLKEDDYSSVSDEDDTRNGGTCLSGNI